MPVPGVVAADLVVVEAGLVLGGLEALLDRPAGPGDADQLLVGGAGRGAAQVVGQLQLALGVAGQRAADQQVAGPAGRLGAVCGQGGGRPVVDPGAFGAVAAAAALPCLAGGVRGQDVGAGGPGVAGGRPGCWPRRRRSRPGAAPARPGTCRPCRRPRPRSPTRPGTPASSARPSISRASSGLVANCTSSGTPASRQRSRSSVHDFGRYSSRSISARPFGDGVGQEHAQLAVLDPPGGARVLPLHPGRPGPLLQEPGLVDHQHAVRRRPGAAAT